MTQEVALALAIPLSLGIAAFGGSLGIGRAVAAAMEAIGRQPEASGKIMVTMIVGCALIEALTIYALIIAFMKLA